MTIIIQIANGNFFIGPFDSKDEAFDWACDNIDAAKYPYFVLNLTNPKNVKNLK